MSDPVIEKEVETTETEADVDNGADGDTTEEAPENQETQEPEGVTWEEWLKGQAPDVQEAYEENVAGLKSALQKERAAREAAERQVSSATKTKKKAPATETETEDDGSQSSLLAENRKLKLQLRDTTLQNALNAAALKTDTQFVSDDALHSAAKLFGSGDDLPEELDADEALTLASTFLEKNAYFLVSTKSRKRIKSVDAGSGSSTAKTPEDLSDEAEKKREKDLRKRYNIS